MKNANKKTGFTIVEMLLSLTILAMLMAAVAVAFDAAVSSFQVNERISKTANTARAALLRMTTELRTSQAVAPVGASTGDDASNIQCSLITSTGSSVCYRYSSDDKILYLDTDGDSYPLCKNVTSATFDRATSLVNGVRIVRNVRIKLTLTDDKGNNPQTFVAAAVVRRNL